MLNILPVDESATPTQKYAHACWAANPRISPAYWHEALGHTVGKIALDWRAAIHQPALLGQGVNLILATPETLPAAHALIAASGVEKEAIITLCLAADPADAPAATAVVWAPAVPPSPEQVQAALACMEEGVKQGKWQAYGVEDPDMSHADTPLPLHRWLEHAGQAAAAVWGRRKRPALRLLVADMDLLDLSWLTTANSRHGEDTVTPLEHAARLGLSVVALPGVMPRETAMPPQPALDALTHFAVAEQQLAETLGGWPAWNGRLLFNVLTPLAAGQAPWPTPAHWRHWQRHLQPFAQARLAEMLPQSIAATSTFAAYTAAARALAAWGPLLAQGAAQPLVSQAVSHLSARLPGPWQAMPPATLASALISGLPAVSALAVACPVDIQAIQKNGDFPDSGLLFT